MLYVRFVACDCCVIVVGWAGCAVLGDGACYLSASVFVCAWLHGVVPIVASAAGAALAIVLMVAAVVAASVLRAFEVAVEERSVSGAYGEGFVAGVGLFVCWLCHFSGVAVHGDCHCRQCNRCDGGGGGGCDRCSRPNLTLLHGVLPLFAASRRCALRPSQHTV